MAVEGMSYPSALKELAGKDYVFQIRFTPYITLNHRTFTVSAISSNKQSPVIYVECGQAPDAVEAVGIVKSPVQFYILRLLVRYCPLWA
ncbi:hypothetical protein DY000_02049261 [Brassica cretica]|uniref:Uncharacterized protein n=1 Tax=Brassica cretica TaxID=69181 RepID=A0ABQ7F7C7_BRACR|nr:hypothetical protein DY000_02049261 [Brassica cretica]